MKQSKEHKVNIRTDKKTKDALEKLAAENKRALSDYLRLLYQHAIEHKLKF